MASIGETESFLRVASTTHRGLMTTDLPKGEAVFVPYFRDALVGTPLSIAEGENRAAFRG